MAIRGTFLLLLIDFLSETVYPRLPGSQRPLGVSVIFFEKAHSDLGSSRWPKEVRSDNGTEFTKDLLTEFCREHGTTGNFTLLYSSYQNGTAERMDRTVLEKTRALLSQGPCPGSFMVGCGSVCRVPYKLDT